MQCRIKGSILLLFLFLLFILSAFSSTYAMESTIAETETSLKHEYLQVETVNEKTDDIHKNEPKEKSAKLNIKTIGEGSIRITDLNENILKYDATDEVNEWNDEYLLNTEIKIEAEVQDKSCFIYGFYIKTEDNPMKQENIIDEGFMHKVNLTLDADTEVLVVFAKIDDKEIVFENPLDDRSLYQIQPMSLGDVGQNWGMYNLFTKYTVISEFGTRSAYLYGHIIQADTNHDSIYEDATHTAYCVEYNDSCPAGGYLTESEFSLKEQENIGYTMAYGWRQKETSYVEDPYYDQNSRCEIAVTQGVIWCFIEGIFDTAAGESAMTKIINATYQPEYAQKYYENLKQTLLNIHKKPSFDNQTLTLEWNKNNKRFETTIYDENGMLSLFDYSHTGIGFEKNGNYLTIYTLNEYPNGIQVSGKRLVYGGADSVVKWDGWNGNQDMVTYKDTSHEIVSKMIINTKKTDGALKLIKKSAMPEITTENTNYSLENAVYNVYSDELCKVTIGTLITDTMGISKDLSLTEGTYYVKEKMASEGYFLDEEVYEVMIQAGKDTVLEVQEKPVLGKIIVTKTIHSDDVNFDNGNPMFMFKLTGVYPNGSRRIYYDIVDFEKEYVTNYADEYGDVHMSIVFENLSAGEYILEEMSSSRYFLESISDVRNGRVKGEEVLFSITSSTSMEGSVRYINDNYEQQKYSDTSKIINELKK